MNFPSLLIIKFLNTIDLLPVKNICIFIKLFSKNKNDYYFIPQSSNEKGEILVRKEWVEEQIMKEVNLFPMDYSSKLSECSDSFQIKLMTRNDIKKAIESIKLYNFVFDKPEIKIKQLSNSENYKFKNFNLDLNINCVKNNKINVLLEKC